MLFLFEHKLIYPGTIKIQRTEFIETIKKHGFTVKFFKISDYQIEYFERNINSDNNILILTGNAEEPIYYLPYFSKLFKSYNIYSLNYPSYGDSTGIISEHKITESIESLIELKDLDKKNLIILGRSLGTGFATKINSLYPHTSKLILVSPYYSMESLARDYFPIIPKFITSTFMENKIETYKYAEKINNPVLILYTRKDTVVFREGTEKLAHKFKNKKIFNIENVNHSSILSSKESGKKIVEFIEEKKQAPNGAYLSPFHHTKKLNARDKQNL